MNNFLKYGTFILLILTLLSCSNSETHYAPVVDIGKIESIPKKGQHTVKPGETLYAIAWRYGLDYRYLAQINHLSSPYVIYRGQVIYLRKAAVKHTRAVKQFTSKHLEVSPIVPMNKNIFSNEATLKSIEESRFNQARIFFAWPAKGKVINGFSQTNKGINIIGQLGEPVYASEAGKVVYCGDGLRSYGNLIILKHNSEYLSAYAYNQAIFVREGEWVQKGQKLAEMGSDRLGRAILHFEIRKAGIPINPLTLLPS